MFMSQCDFCFIFYIKNKLLLQTVHMSQTKFFLKSFKFKKELQLALPKNCYENWLI